MAYEYSLISEIIDNAVGVKVDITESTDTYDDSVKYITRLVDTDVNETVIAYHYSSLTSAEAKAESLTERWE